jgi:dTDP-4-amino-4,6-dideoxygalactose transaminase
MDPLDVERKITPRTKAILVVHLFGNPCDMDAMVDIARRHQVALIEDCSQAHCTEYRGRLLGQFGDIAAFSLQQSKHMTTGDGGMTITSRPDLERRMMLFTDKGWTRQPGWGARVYELLAPNYRMTELQAAVGIAQIDKVKGVVDRRHALGSLLTERLAGVAGLRPAPVTPGGRHSYWLYALGMERFDALEFAKALSAEGVPAGAGYIGEPIYTCMAALSDRRTFGNSAYPLDGAGGHAPVEYPRGLCPRTEAALRGMVTLGINERYAEGDVEDMARAIRKVAEGLAAGPVGR